VESCYATAITYHASGMTDSITHAKRIVSVEPGVVDRQSIATNEMARPAQIWTEGATLSGTGADADWDTGVHAYDGAGTSRGRVWGETRAAGRLCCVEGEGEAFRLSIWWGGRGREMRACGPAVR